MSRRARQRDTEADRQLYECIESSPPVSFLMVAGAGSGKTTSLIKGLKRVIKLHGKALTLRRQRIACVTYTEIAAQEILRDVGDSALVHVCTIHSFLWSLVQPFQRDIRNWVGSRIEERLQELQSEADNFGTRVRQRTREKNEAEFRRYQGEKERIASVRSFVYGTGSDYSNGVLGHDDIIKMVPRLISERLLMRKLVAQLYPIMFVDESQDTFESVVASLKAIHRDCGEQFCVGFFGDPMQQIYATGVGAIAAEHGWRTIEKQENFRCPRVVLAVSNAIRRSGDGLVQTLGRPTAGNAEDPGGTASLFVLPRDENRDRRLSQVRSWAAERTGDPLWAHEQASSVKVLVIVHRMAAKRLGFSDLYAAMNDKAPEEFKSGFREGTAWPLRPFLQFVVPLADAVRNQNEFEIIQILREQSPRLASDNLAVGVVPDLLLDLRHITQRLASMMEPGAGASIGEVLRFLHDTAVIQLDSRIVAHLNLRAERDMENATDADDDVTKEVSAMAALLACDASQVWGYIRFLSDESPFSTQQGVKGAEFKRVLVVLDDEEGKHNQFSYEKYFGLRELSDTDKRNSQEGKDTVVARTRRLFYVCCTRALKDLVVVFFAADAVTAHDRIASLGLFPPDSIFREDVLSRF